MQGAGIGGRLPVCVHCAASSGLAGFMGGLQQGLRATRGLRRRRHPVVPVSLLALFTACVPLPLCVRTHGIRRFHRNARVLENARTSRVSTSGGSSRARWRRLRSRAPWTSAARAGTQSGRSIARLRNRRPGALRIREQEVLEGRAPVMGAGAGAKLEQARNEGALAKRRAEAGVGRADGAAEVVRVQERLERQERGAERIGPRHLRGQVDEPGKRHRRTQPRCGHDAATMERNHDIGSVTAEC